MLVTAYGSAVEGVNATAITIEVNMAAGQPFYANTGLPDSAIKEGLEGICSAGFRASAEAWGMSSAETRSCFDELPPGYFMRYHSRSWLYLLNLCGLIILIGCKPQKMAVPDRAAQAFVATAMSKPDTVVVLQTYGLSRMSSAEKAAQSIVALKWNVSFQSVAGCLVSEQLIKSVKLHNDSVISWLNKKHGPEWRSNIERETPIELEREQIVTMLVRKQAHRDRQPIPKRLALIYFSKLSPDHYLASVEEDYFRKGKRKLVYQYLVNINTKRAALVSDSIVVTTATR